MTTSAQNTTGILNTTESIHNTTSPGDTIVHRGVVSSEYAAHLTLPPQDETQTARILPHRPDGATYSGILIFTVTKLVEVGFGHRLHIDNSTHSQFETEQLGELYTRHHVNSNE
jgi:hypothetical protein